MTMKKIFLMIAALALISTSAGAADYVGLYTDATTHSACEEYGMAMFDVYLWHLPDAVRGNMSTELLITFPLTLACTGKTYCADMTLTKDDITAAATGGSIAWSMCALDWKWSAKLTFLDTGFYSGNPTVGYVQIVNHPISEGIWIASCEDGFPTYIATPLNRFGLNQPCYEEIGTEPSSWGAIKNLQ